MPGTGYVANPAAISAYSSVIARQVTPLTGINAALAGVRLPANAFGMLPEAGALHAAYTSHASDLAEITAKLPRQIGDVAEELSSTAESYDELEHGMASDIRTMFGARGGGAGTGGGPAGAFGDITSGSSGAYRWTSEPTTPIPALAAGLAPSTGGLSGLIDEALNWVIDHVPELMKLLNDVTGDWAALERAAGVWHNQGVALNSVVRDLRESAAPLPRDWGGQASASFGGFMGDVTQALGTIATSMGQTQQILDDAAREAAFAHNTIVMIIREVVEWVGLNIIADAATLGLATAVEAPATAAFLATRVEEAAQAAGKLASVYRGLLRTVKALQDAKQDFTDAEGFARLTRFLTTGQRFADGLKVGKLTMLRMADGKLAKLGRTVLESGLHGPDGETLRDARELGTGGIASAAVARTGMGELAHGVGLTGLGKDIAEGAVKNPLKEEVTGHQGQAENTLQGAEETVGIKPPIPSNPPAGQIEAILNGEQPPKENPP